MAQPHPATGHGWERSLGARQPSSNLGTATSWLPCNLAVPRFPHLSGGDDGKCSSHQAVVAHVTVSGKRERARADGAGSRVSSSGSNACTRGNVELWAYYVSRGTQGLITGPGHRMLGWGRRFESRSIKTKMAAKRLRHQPEDPRQVLSKPGPTQDARLFPSWPEPGSPRA